MKRILLAAGVASAALVTSGLTAPAALAAGTDAASVPGGVQTVTIGPLTQEFAPLVAADPAQRKLLAGWRRDVILVDVSTEERRVVAPGADYVTGAGLTYLEGFIAAEVKGGFGWVGTDLQWDVKITSQGSTTAVVTSCDNDSQVEMQSISTGELTPLPEAVWHLAETYDMVLVSGQWAVSELTVTHIPAGQAPCGL